MVRSIVGHFGETSTKSIPDSLWMVLLRALFGFTQREVMISQIISGCSGSCGLSVNIGFRVISRLLPLARILAKQSHQTAPKASRPTPTPGTNRKGTPLLLLNPSFVQDATRGKAFDVAMNNAAKMLTHLFIDDMLFQFSCGLLSDSCQAKNFLSGGVNRISSIPTAKHTAKKALIT